MGDPPSHKITSPIFPRRFPCGSGQSQRGPRVCRSAIRTAIFHLLDLDAGNEAEFPFCAWRALLGGGPWMPRFQGIVADSARRCKSKMHDRRPAFQLVVAVV